MTGDETRTDTKQRLLAAACEIFSSKGFRAATVAEICKAADANIAAVNYHFGGKRELYLTAWRETFDEAIAAHPFDGGVSDEASPEDRLRGIINSALRRALHDGRLGFWSKMLLMELYQPSGILGKAKMEAMRPLRTRMHALMQEMLGPDATEQESLMCGMSIMTQVIGTGMRMRFGLPGGGPEFLERPDFDALADHIARFALGGIAEVRAHIETRTP